MTDREQDRSLRTGAQAIAAGGILAVGGFLYSSSMGVLFWLNDGDTTALFVGAVCMVVGIATALGGKLYPMVVSRV